MKIDDEPAELRFPAWQREYESALLETDGAFLLEKIGIAETAILNRRLALSGSRDHQEELRAIADALINLHVLRRNS